MDFKIKKTVGHAGEGQRKDYTITTDCGTEFFCWATGSQGYTCNGVKFKSIKDIKSHIEEDSQVLNDKGGFERDDDEVAQIEPDQPLLWNQCCPAAMLAVMSHDRPAYVKARNEEWELLVKETLDAYGFIQTDGSVDIECAQKEIKRALKCATETKELRDLLNTPQLN